MRVRFAPLVCVLAACVPKAIPPAAPTARAATPVAASFGRTWDAVIDDFAARNIAVRTLDRASGFIVAEPAVVERPTYLRTPHRWADCGTQPQAGYIAPTLAIYNIVVRGDSAAATVRATVRWTATAYGAPANAAGLPGAECTTRGVWESAFEETVKARAEAPRAAAR